MAKRKRGRALFEVMSQHRGAGGRTEPTPSRGGIPTPKWWFKSKNRGDVRTFAPGETLADAPVEPKAVVYSSSSSQQQQQQSVATPFADERRSRHEPAMSADDSAEHEDEADPTMSSASSSFRPQPLSVSVDRDGQQISLRLSYTSALIGGFGLFIVIGIAVLIGRGFSKGPAPAAAEVSTAALRQGPASPGVLSVPRKSDGGGGIIDTMEGSSGTPPRSSGTGGRGTSTGTRNPQQVTEPRPPATFFTDDPHRQNGLNYAIIQSYPDRETAEKAAEFLTKSAIPCTVEKNLPSWKLPWSEGCVVVGIRGFAKVSNNPQLEAYKKQIAEASVKFTNGRRGFTAFAPTMYLWRKSN
jgi:hypothetical protein